MNLFNKINDTEFEERRARLKAARAADKTRVDPDAIPPEPPPPKPKKVKSQTHPAENHKAMFITCMIFTAIAADQGKIPWVLFILGMYLLLYAIWIFKALDEIHDEVRANNQATTRPAAAQQTTVLSPEPDETPGA